MESLLARPHKVSNKVSNNLENISISTKSCRQTYLLVHYLVGQFSEDRWKTATSTQRALTDEGVKHLFVRIYIAHYVKTMFHIFHTQIYHQFRSDRP